MRQAILRGDTLDSMAALHEVLRQELAFPDYYGGNLDALADCLTDGTEETEITILGAALLRERLGETAVNRLLRVLHHCAEENPGLHLKICL